MALRAGQGSCALARHQRRQIHATYFHEPTGPPEDFSHARETVR